MFITQCTDLQLKNWREFSSLAGSTVQLVTWAFSGGLLEIIKLSPQTTQATPSYMHVIHSSGSGKPRLCRFSQEHQLSINQLYKMLRISSKAKFQAMN